MNEKDIFLKAVDNSGLTMTEFLDELLEMKKEGGRTPYMMYCIRKKVQYKKENDPYQNSYNYYTETEKRLGSNSRLMDHIDKIQTWVSNQANNVLTEKQNVIVKQKKDIKLSQNLILNEDVKRKTEEIDRKIFEEYVKRSTSIDEQKLYIIRIKKDTLDMIFSLVKENTNLSIYKYLSLIREYMSRHIHILFSLSKSEIIELLEVSGDEFNNLEFSPTNHKKSKSFTLKPPIHNQIQKLNDTLSLNMSVQELSRRLFRYYAYRVYKIFEGK